MTLEVAGEAPVAADPGEGTLDDPALGQHLEAWHVVALDDLEAPGAGCLTISISSWGTMLARAP